jgi:predicted phosphodiesterase
MEVILIGDIHGRTIWKQIVERHPDADHYVFFGDYFDPYEDIPYWELAKNFKAIVQLKKELGYRVVLLLGNHDLHYYADVEPCSRYDYLIKIVLYQAPVGHKRSASTILPRLV